MRAEAKRLLAAGVAGGAFPGAVACVAWRDEDGEPRRVVATCGARGPDERPVEEDTYYDLGAVTQCVVGVLALRAEAGSGIDLDAEVESLLTPVRGGVLAGATVRELLEHRAGLASWGGLYLDVPHERGSPAARRWILSEAARRGGDRGRGEHARSDLGYLIAGEAIASACGEPLAELVERDVLGPLGLTGQLVYAGALPSDRRAALAARAAPTERCAWRGRLLEGEVQDENAAAFGGVAGHAGLFGTAAGLASFGGALLDSVAGDSSFLTARQLSKALPSAADPSERYGFVGKRGDAPACGRRMCPDAFGQLGFPGTSIFCDPERRAVLVLLTNRVCPSRANAKIDGFRPAFHDGVMAALAG